MSHIVPILCLIFFVWIIEVRLEREIFEIEKELNNLKESIKNNSDKIDIIKEYNGEYL